MAHINQPETHVDPGGEVHGHECGRLGRRAHEVTDIPLGG
jgi:hypothetical protein